MVGRIGLEAREFKLLIDPSWLKGAPSRGRANAFFRAHIEPIIAAELGEERKGSRFDEDERRVLRFWDTPDGLLARQDFTLRERVAAADDKKDRARREMTLKLRTPDLFLAAATRLPGARRDAESKFEEDVAPLEVAEPSGRVALADPRSIRSRFALSTKQTVGTRSAFVSLDKAFAHFPTLEENLVAGGVAVPEGPAELTPGFTVREFVAKGATVDLGKKVTGEFALTIWDFETGAPRPRIAEISYKCPLPNGRLSANVARRALRLFLAMQLRLGDLIDLSATSKTALALGKREARSAEGVSRALGAGMQYV